MISTPAARDSASTAAATMGMRVGIKYEFTVIGAVLIEHE
jgi:hypothetical protein